MFDRRANAIYDVLESIGGANPANRSSFVQYLLSDEKYVEWRFAGKLGFGGKYYGDNRVDCYPEHYNEETKAIIAEINHKLKELEPDGKPQP